MIKKEYFVILFVLIAYAVCMCLGVTCIIKETSGIPCPTCFMTRAIMSLIRGDVKSYVSYNIMALPVAIVFLAEVFNMHFKRHKKILHIVSVIVLIINLIYYIWRMANGYI